MRSYRNFVILEKKETAEDTHIFVVKPEDKHPLHFKAGQYVFLKNPNSTQPDAPHPFSIASSPTEDSLEFCIKTYGEWTKQLKEASVGDLLEISEAQGNFIWDSAVEDGVFLLGGIGISPIMSMLRLIRTQQTHPHSLIMLYGNRTPQTVAYREELTKLQKALPMLKIVDIFSHLPEGDLSTGYRGFITKEILEKEVNLITKPTFFYIGPPIFIQKMDDLLTALHIPETNRRKEDFSLVKTA